MGSSSKVQEVQDKFESHEHDNPVPEIKECFVQIEAIDEELRAHVHCVEPEDMLTCGTEVFRRREMLLRRKRQNPWSRRNRRNKTAKPSRAKEYPMLLVKLKSSFIEFYSFYVIQIKAVQFNVCI
jgi:hypothetical protein